MALPLQTVQRVDSAGLEFSALADWPLIVVALLDVLCVDVAGICGLEKISDRRVVGKFLSTAVYSAFVKKSRAAPGCCLEMPELSLSPIDVHRQPL